MKIIDTANGSMMHQERKDIESRICKAWLEGLVIAILLFAIVRIISYIGIGFDPHHDYYAFAPGLYFSEGLQPHKDFYTHYGAIDAAFKGVLITIFGKSLYSLRLSLLILNFVGLLSICYFTRRTRYERIWLLILISIWAAFDPSSGASGATSFWHHLGWSSDVAVFLISIICVISYWYWQLSLSSLEQSRLISSSEKTDRYALNKKEISLLNHLQIYVLGASQGIIVAFIFFTKFTIGLSMIAAILASNIVIQYLFLVNDAKKEDSAIFNAERLNISIRLLLKALSLKTLFIPAIGFIIGSIFALALIGGPAYFKDFANDVFLSQYQYFSGGSNTVLLRKLLPILVTHFAVISIIVSVLVLSTMQRLSFAMLLAAVLILSISSKAIDLRNIAMGTISTPDYAKLVNYCIAGLAVVGSIFAFAELKQPSRASLHDIIYPSIIAPIGLFSLTQFYPLLDPFHGWWAVGTALPLAAWVMGDVAKKRSLAWSSNIIKISLSLCFLFTIWSFAIHAKNLNKYSFQEIEQGKSNAGFLSNIRSADVETIGLLNDAKSLAEANPKTIILESGSGSFVDLMNSSTARKALAFCKIKPLHLISQEEKESNLKCLQQLKSSDWSVALANNHSYSTSKERLVQDVKVWPWAVLEPVGETPIPETFKSSKQERKYKRLTYWPLD